MASVKSASLSVSILTYNEASNIEQCIASLGAFDPALITIWDGGSTDATRDIAARLGVRVEHHPGTSISERRGMGILHCTTDFIIFVDADQSLIDNPHAVVDKYFGDPTLGGVQFSLRQAKQVAGYWANGFGYRLQM